MRLSIYNKDGTNSNKRATLKDEIFAIEPNDTLIYEDIRAYLANQRRGTAKTKERSEVRGGGRKAYRQKGTGMARRGSIRSPLLKGGGTVFGPQPRDYTIRLNKKMRIKARKSALTYKAQDKGIMMVEDFSFEEPKTRQLVQLLEALGINDRKVLILTSELDRNLYKSSRNLKHVQVIEGSKPTTYDIVNADTLLIQKGALDSLQSILETDEKSTGGES